jgi:hypothetical protein
MKVSSTLQLILLNGFVLQAHYVTRSLMALSPDKNETTATEYANAPPVAETKTWSFSLQELLGDDDDAKLRTPCDEDLYFMENTFAPTQPNTRRRIPNTVHVTGRTRCLTKPFHDNLRSWHFTNYSFVFHDENAVDRLLQKKWPEFPHLNKAMKCIHSGAGKADLWRYLLLWEYGGIYTDMDTAPRRKFLTERGGWPIISDQDDAFFVVEDSGVLSQYFMAVSPRHPLMYFAALHTLRRLMEVENVGNQYAPFVTGPGALKSAFITFMGTDGTGTHNKVLEGRYMGLGNRTVTVAGSRKTSNHYIKRYSVLPKDKKTGYARMGMVHFSKSKDQSRNVTCFAHLYNTEYLDATRIG